MQNIPARLARLENMCNCTKSIQRTLTLPFPLRSYELSHRAPSSLQDGYGHPHTVKPIIANQRSPRPQIPRIQTPQKSRLHHLQKRFEPPRRRHLPQIHHPKPQRLHKIQPYVSSLRTQPPPFPSLSPKPSEKKEKRKKKKKNHPPN